MNTKTAARRCFVFYFFIFVLFFFLHKTFGSDSRDIWSYIWCVCWHVQVFGILLFHCLLNHVHFPRACTKSNRIAVEYCETNATQKYNFLRFDTKSSQHAITQSKWMNSECGNVSMNEIIFQNVNYSLSWEIIFYGKKIEAQEKEKKPNLVLMYNSI